MYISYSSLRLEQMSPAAALNAHTLDDGRNDDGGTTPMRQLVVHLLNAVDARIVCHCVSCGHRVRMCRRQHTQHIHIEVDQLMSCGQYLRETLAQET